MHSAFLTSGFKGSMNVDQGIYSLVGVTVTLCHFFRIVQYIDALYKHCKLQRKIQNEDKRVLQERDKSSDIEQQPQGKNVMKSCFYQTFC